MIFVDANVFLRHLFANRPPSKTTRTLLRQRPCLTMQLTVVRCS